MVKFDLTDPAGQSSLRKLLQRERPSYGHAAPPCGTMSRARDNPIPLALQRLGAPSPPPLRSKAFRAGLPSKAGLDLQKVTLANALADYVGEVMEEFHDEGILFTIENPLNSYLWLLPRYVRLAKLPGVRMIRRGESTQASSAYDKPPAAIHEDVGT